MYLNNMKFKFIILIISQTNRNNRLDSFKKHWEVYMNKFPEIKCYFIEYRNQEQDIIKKGNYLYLKGEEKIIPNLFYKTIKSIEYINKNYDYDFLLRTNLSTKFNLKKLLNFYKT